jgi:hypothetical protein
MNPNLEDGLPMTAYMSAKGRQELARSLEEVWLEFLGPERFEAYQEQVTPPAWLANLPRLPDRDKNGLLPV